MIACHAGYTDMDLEPEVGVLKMTVRGNGMSLIVRGRSTSELAEKLMERLG